MLRSMSWSLVLALGACGAPADDGPGDDTAAPDAAGGSWAETAWCDDLSDLSDLRASYDGTDPRGALIALSERRYPPAVGFVEAQSDAELGRWLTGGGRTFDQLLDSYEVVVHEGSHIWGFARFGFDGYSYRVVDDDRVVTTAFLDNFDRSAILERHPDAGSDFYASTYLSGQLGAQGFNTLLDEYNAYAHSLVSRYCTRDALPQGVSTTARDGILTFMWYVETYLAIAREDHPADYRAILDDPGHVELILSVWDRAEHWLAITDGDPRFGIDDAAIAERVYDPAALAEIDRVRDAR